MCGSEALLIIFAKYPEVGQVKTRLAPDIGRERACALYRLLVQAVLHRTCPEPDDPYTQLVCYTPASRAAAFAAFVRNECGYRGPLAPQVAGDLGVRMGAAFEQALAAGARRVVLIGTDSPLLSRRRILQALDSLRSVPVVLGPAADGGYYLVGLSRRGVDLFRDIPWGTDQVYARTRERIAELSLPLAALPMDFDVDDLATLRRLKTVLGTMPPDEEAGLERLRAFLEMPLCI